ncbi:MAG TPA: DNA-processing protein DprA [Pilimelia sp.]|nr:DNA-processing protein DprA [Pilimelia sp.]
MSERAGTTASGPSTARLAPGPDRDADRVARVALTWLVEPGNRIVHRLVARHGAVDALDTLLTGDAPDQGLRAAVAARLRAGDPYRVAELALVRAERLGARIATPHDPEWPAQLDDLIRLDGLGGDRRVDRETQPPLCLWVRGSWPLDQALSSSVAVVGSRAATAYGNHVATDLAYGLAERDWTVVSGGAYGIDAAAHRGALTYGGITVAVLACGVDRPYPAGNAALFERIADSGLLVSEWPPGSEPHRHRFLIRNRVIAAATAGTVMVEASARSGATSTLRRAVALKRPAMVVPGPVTSAMSVGCHDMLREHPSTRVVTGLPHVLDEIGRIGLDLAPLARGPVDVRDDLDPDSAQLLEVVPARRTIGAEEIAARAGIELRTALRKLALLTDLGLLRRASDGYALVGRPRRRK